MTNLELKRYSRDVLKKLGKALPENKDLFNEVSHLVVDLRKAAAQIPSANVEHYIRENAWLQQENAALRQRNEKVTAEVEQKRREYEAEVDARCQAELDRLADKSKAAFVEATDKVNEMIEAIDLLDPHVTIYSLKPLQIAHAEMVGTFLQFLASERRTSHYPLTNGMTLVWSMVEDRVTGLILTPNDIRRFSRVKQMTPKDYKRLLDGEWVGV